MSDQQDFFRAIRESPEDDTLRLIFADWLEDRGATDRAEFIRLQIERAQREGEAIDQGEKPGRESELETRFSDRCEELLAAECNGEDVYCEFRRGFVHKICLHVDAFLQHAESIFSRVPLVDSLVLYDVRPKHCQHLAELPSLRRITKLNLEHNNQIGPVGAGFLAASPYLDQLRELNLDKNYIESEGAEALAQSRHLRLLEVLDLSLNNIGDVGLEALATSLFLVHLRKLYLVLGGIGDTGTLALATSPHMSALTDLLLDGNEISDTGALALVQSPHLKQITHLRLEGNPISDEARAALRQRFGQAVRL
jgi:uncharacterized protein (TIGR02996 family)